MLERSGPNIIEFEEDDFFDNKDVYNMQRENQFFAVTAEQFSRGMRMDPRYVQWVAKITHMTPNGRQDYFYPMKPCTKDLYNRFYPMEKAFKD